MTDEWASAREYDLEKLTVGIGEPVLVARQRERLWFPGLHRLQNGDLIASMCCAPDTVKVDDPTSASVWSFDQGRTWTPLDPLRSRDVVPRHLQLPSGDTIFFSFRQTLHERDGVQEMRSPYHLLPRGSREVEQNAGEIVITGLPMPVAYSWEERDLASFVTNASVVTLRDGSYLATIYGTFKGHERERGAHAVIGKNGYSLIAIESEDGVHWRYRSPIAGVECDLPKREGPCEAAVCRLADGRLMCVFRVGNWYPYGQTWSEDEGRTWSKPVTMAREAPSIAFSVEPSLAVLPNGVVVLSGGRPGLYLWFDREGDGWNWDRLDLLAHHNACRPDEQIKLQEKRYRGHAWTTAYTRTVVLDEKHLLTIYDRIPGGWANEPDSPDETNSVWVVRVTVDPK